MNNDNEIDDAQIPCPNVFWSRGKIEFIQLSKGIDGVYESEFELRCDGITVMPSGTFSQILRYYRAEFEL